MLNVDWGGFGAEQVSTYETPTGAYTVDLSGSVDACELTDVTGDGRKELVTIDYSTKTLSVFNNTSSNSAFKLKGTQTLTSLSGTKGYDSVIIDGDQLIVVSASTGVGLTTTTYQWNGTTSQYVQTSQTSLDVSKFNSSNADICIFVSVAAELVDDTLVVQATTLTTTGTSLKTVFYSGYGSSSFGTNSRVVSAISEELMGSTTINGTDYLILKESTSSSNDLVLASVGSTVSKYTYNLSGYGSSLTFDWVAEQNGFLVLGAQTNGKSGIITIKSTTPVDGADAKALGNWVACDSLKLNASSAAAIGNVGGDSDPELFVVNGNSYVFYLGDASTKYGYTFTTSGVVVSSPEYVSVSISDIDGDGATEALLVGENHLYTASVSDTGKITNVTSKYTFSEAVRKAVYGDFNGDGLLDVAVQFQANVGTGVQVFQQLSDGAFVALATQTFSGSVADIAVGKFSQTAVDELAVLTVKSGTSSSSTVNTLKLNGSGFVATRSYTGSGVVGAALTVGSIYGSAMDDLVVVNTTQDTITVLKNTGSSLTASTITTAYGTTSTAGKAPTSAAIGDFNGDGLADVAVLNSSAGTNYANVVYYLRTEDGGLGAKPTGRVLASSSTMVSSLAAADLNNDGYADLTFLRKTTSGSTYVTTLMGNGSSSVFDSAVNKSVKVDLTSTCGVTLACVDSDNNSKDYVWAQGKNVGVLLNSDTSVASGSVQFICQSLTSGAGASYAEAVSTQRTWLDEWSNFYVDIWANTDGSGAVTSATTTFAYDTAYFTLVTVESAAGYTVSSRTADGVVTVTATGSGSADAQGWTLIGRMKFEPTGGVGVELPSDGVLASVSTGFNASASGQQLNGATVDAASVPNVSLYPVLFDIDENGVVNTNDLGYLQSYLGQSVSAIAEKKYRVFDYDKNGIINTNDLAYCLQALGSSASDGANSGYKSEPLTSSSSAVLDAADLCYAILDADSETEEEAEEALETIAADVVFYGPQLPALSIADFAGPASANLAIATASEAAFSELDVELDSVLDDDVFEEETLL